MAEKTKDDSKKENKFSGPCPYLKANWLSKGIFWWLTPLFMYGFKHPLTKDHLYDVLPEDESSVLTDRMESVWNMEIKSSSAKGKKPVLYRAVMHAFRKEIIFNGIFLAMSETIRVLQPYLIGQLVGYFQPGSTISPTRVYVVAAIMCISSLVQLFVNPKYFFTCHHIGSKMTIAVGGLIYRKILKISSLSLHKTTSGKVINHLSTDLQKFIYAVETIHFAWIAPVEIILVLFLIYQGTGPVCLFSLFVILPVLPIQFLFGWIGGKLRMKIGAQSDKRIHMMNQIIGGMRVIKMYCWEKPFSDLIFELRRKELKVLMKSLVFRALNIGVYLSASRITAMIVFIAAWKFGVSLSATLVYSTIGWIECLRLSVFLFLYYVIEDNTQLYSSLKRIQSFLELEEMDQCQAPNEENGPTNTCFNQSEFAVQLVSMTAFWRSHVTVTSNDIQETSKLVTDQSQEMIESFGLKNIDISIKPGELVAVVGPVGAGKSSLLMTLLKELPVTDGQILVNGTMGYVSQESWVVSGTLQENILFGTDIDSDLYQRVINVCALQKDIENMSNGDQTLVGERGLLLSGGQKARLNLARTIYRAADIYLLDDPLSAVDTEVGNHLFNKCITGFLAGKTRILVTHQLQYLKRVDKIILLKEGRIVDVGTFDEIQKNSYELSSFLNAEDKENEDQLNHVTDADTVNSMAKNEKEEETEEDAEDGSVNWHVYWEYVKSGRPFLFLPLLITLLLVLDVAMLYGDWNLAKWADVQAVFLLDSSSTEIPGTNSSTINSQFGISKDVMNQTFLTANNSTAYFYNNSIPEISSNASQPSLFSNSSGRQMNLPDISVKSYITATCIFVTMSFVLGITHFIFSMTISRNLHKDIFEKVIGAKTRFFDVNPVGRILNRFAKDLGLVDGLLHGVIYAVYEIGFRLLAFCIMTCVINPWLIVPLVPLIVFVILIRQFSVPTTRNMKRIEALTQSPVYSHVSDTLIGLQSIRALGMKKRFIADFDVYQNKHSIANFMFLSTFRWFSIRSLFAVVLYLNMVVILSLVLKDGIELTGALFGLALNYILLLADPFEFFMRLTATVETLMTSVERITAYTKLEQEASKTSDISPPVSWPNKGEITLKDLSLRYSDNSPWILKNLTFSIKENEKIGIVGRTGAGKTSLLSALLRLAEPEGGLFIDDVDILKIGLHELRSKISFIPQDPVLFSGTLRNNLDPFDEYNDEQLWNALDQVKLKAKVDSCQGQLYMEVSEAGHNFSVGQRQLVCLARAILRFNKILILDEATANVDNKTDELIQLTIRNIFRDCTVLTIAHRLHTVMDSDRVLVLHHGEVKEFGQPYDLLQIQNGFFKNLCDQTGESQSQYLQSLALAAVK